MTRRTLLIIRVTVFLAACGYLFLRFKEQPLDDLWASMRDHAQHPPVSGLLVLFLLMLLNWGLEAWKWRWLVAPVQTMSLSKALQATFAGTSIALITPNRTGEFIGRVLFLAPQNRVPGVLTTLLGSLAQFTVTVLFGALALLLVPFKDGFDPLWRSVLVSLAALVIALLLLAYFRPQLIRRGLQGIPLVGGLSHHLAVLEDYPVHRSQRALLISALRYAVFSAQSVLAIELFTEGDVLETVLVVPVMFLFTSLVPSMLLTELGVRGSVAITLLHARAPEGVLLATTVIWLINLVLPAVIGAVLLVLARVRLEPVPAS